MFILQQSHYHLTSERKWHTAFKLSSCMTIQDTADFFLYIHGSVHHNSILIRSNKMQHYAGIYLPQNYSTCFGRPSHPSSGVRKTVTVASGTGHITCQINNLQPAWPIGHAG